MPRARALLLLVFLLATFSLTGWKIGWAAAVGFQLNLPGGDAFGFNACYTEGAPGFCTNEAAYQNYNASTSVGLGWITVPFGEWTYR